MLVQTPSPVCHCCKQREAHERELREEEEETCLMHVGSGPGPVCRELQVFGTAECGGRVETTLGRGGWELNSNQGSVGNI